MRQFVRNPPKDKILPKKYWRSNRIGAEYKLRPMGYKECEECHFFFPIFGRGIEPKRCYRCSCVGKYKGINRRRTALLSPDNALWINDQGITNFSEFINSLIDDLRKMIKKHGVILNKK